MLRLMNPKHSLLMVALGLITSASPALAGEIIISALPYTISSAGTYILKSALTNADTSQPAITINADNLTGPVVLNLKGYEITCPPTGGSVGISIYASGNTYPFIYNAYPVTVENGAIDISSYGVMASGVNTITVRDLKVFQEGNELNHPTPAGVYFSFVVNSVVENCTFLGAYPGLSEWYGIEEIQPGGNCYRNIVVDAPTTVLESRGGYDQQISVAIDNCKLGTAPVPPLK
jgi:hypothetical protein